MKGLTSLEKAVGAFQGCWNVYHYNFNTSQIEPYNCLSHAGFIDQIAQEYLEGLTLDSPEFEKCVESSAGYFFRSRCEYEVLIAGWPPTKDRKEEVKIDCYDQLQLNWEQFLRYLRECILQADWAGLRKCSI